MRKVLVTGISGFAGSFLAEYLLSNGDYLISGTYLSDSSLTNLSKIKDQLDLVKIDLTDTQGVSSLIRKIKPDMIFHLAAQPSPAASFKNPSLTINNNITAQLNLLEAIRENNFTRTRTLIVSSAEAYGLVSKKDLPIDEETKFAPMSPYGVSKIAQDFLGLQYFLSYNLNIIRVRPFNHVGPRLSSQFAPSAFAKKIAEIEKQKTAPKLRVGNLDAKRDFTDVRDIVVGYHLLMEKGKSGEVYNIGSGVSYKISEILEILLSLSSVKIKVEVDRELLRPNDIPELICDNTKIKNLTGWKPKIPIDVSLKDTLDYWRKII